MSRRARHGRAGALASTPWRLCAATAFALGLTLLAPTSASAQGILAPGDAVVTGFSGIKAPEGPVPQGTDPLDLFAIDLDGPSAQIFRLGVPGAPPQGQLVQAPTPHKVPARDVGQVFPIALDDSAIPNIYLGQTSAFGIQIVGPDSNGDGRPDRLRKGQANAQWMPGQFGTGGGPGSIYKVDGRTGVVTLFATIPGNSGAGLGDIVFDNASRNFFVSDLDTGLIHRLNANGALIDSFDHGVTGRPARGLAPVADDGATMNIKAGGFDVENSDTWGFTQPERRVWGMAIDRGRLFYAVANGVWSIGINTDGSFANDPRLELEVTSANDGQVISDIVFDAEGRMYLAQRGAIRGSYDYSVFAESEQSAVLRYKRDPATPGVWVAEEYAIGFPPDHRNAAGGVALGYSHDESGTIRRGSCNRMLWSTGDNLRNNEMHAAKLGDEGPLDVHGLQGNDVVLVRPQNEPPFKSYFVDYDGQFGDQEKAGHVGDVEIWQPCENAPGFGELLPGYPPPDYIPTGDWLPPGGGRPTNLKLEKKAIACWKIGGGKHRCGFRITVTNTGPGVYHDHIKVRDHIPDVPGVTAIFSSPTFDACPGGPPNYTCSSLAPVHLHPWEHVTIPVRVDVPDNVAKQLDCRVRNRARILHAPSPSEQNSNPADDEDAATAHLPAHLCKKEKTNLKITKRALGCFKYAHDKYRCGYHVRVWNTGPGVYNDKIEVTDSVPPGTTAIFSGAGWTCPGPGLGPDYLCKRDPVVLNPFQSVLLVVRVNVSEARAKEMGCKVRNRARIDYAPSPSDKNTNPGDDHASTVADIPAEVCEERTNLVLTKNAAATNSDCPLTGNATWCKIFGIGVRNAGPGTFNGQIKVRDLAPANTKVSFNGLGFWTCNANTKVCQTNGSVELKLNGGVAFTVQLSGDNNDARALNCKLNNWARIIDPVGPSKNTQAADDQDHAAYDLPAELCLPPPVPVHEPTCPAGYRWTGDQCGPRIVTPPPSGCPDGQSLSQGHCCPAGLVWNGLRCGRQVVDECPNGTVGKPPNCRTVNDPKECPRGTVGRWPNCKRPEPRKCPTGMVGTPPNCKRVVVTTCPGGMVGKPPNCKRPVFKRPLVINGASNRVPPRTTRIHR